MRAELEQPAEAIGRLSCRWAKAGVTLAATLATILLLFRPTPIFPTVGLVPSYGYALNEAVARHFVFGRDIIFTFGPFASVSTQLYNPATEVIRLIGSGLFALAFAIGCVLLTDNKHRYQIIALPVLVAEIIQPNALYIFLPFVLLTLVVNTVVPVSNVHHLRSSRIVIAAIAVVTCAVALLPLIKGSFSGSAFFSGGLILLVLLWKRPIAAVAFGSLFFAVLTFAWVAAGQPIDALPEFLISQAPLVSGYSEAMSVPGRLIEPIVYFSVSTILLFIFYVRFSKGMGFIGLITLLSLGLTFFICFKAGFVRHDGHALIAAGALLIGAFCVSTVARRFSLIWMAWTLAILGWAYIDHYKTGLTADRAYQRISQAVSRSYNGIRSIASNPQSFKAVFDAQNAAIRARIPLPPVDGSVDVYPWELSSIFAHGLGWSPRPIMQSYTAYGAQLDKLNSDHLRGNAAPRHVFFSVETIDNRLPSLDDAGSWPILLSMYEVVGYAAGQIHMKRKEPAGKEPSIGPLLAEIPAYFGTPVPIPSRSQPLWASIDLAPTLLGQLALAAFKVPAVQVTLTLENDHIVHHRYIPEMGQRGFLLSPYIHSTEDFMLLASAVEQNTRVRTIQFDTTVRGLWSDQFIVRLRTLNIPAQPDVTGMISIKSLVGPH
jgi:hypothetical protein